MCKVSVIINCYNGEKYLRETIDSIFNQTYKDFELIFWDNCSEDGSKEIIDSYSKIFPNVKYYCSKSNVPLGRARNFALEKSNGDYIAYVDCDDIWESEKLAKQVNALDRDKSCGMVFSNFRRWNMLNGVTDVFDKDANYRELSFEELVGKYSFCLSSFMIRRSALEGLDHIFNEEFRYAEEFELFSRIAFSWNTVYLPEPMVTYRIHKEMNTIKYQDRIGYEYGIALDNLRKMDDRFSEHFPDIEKRISFIRDFSDAKYLIRLGEGERVCELMYPYLFYNYRALCFWCVAHLPDCISKVLANLFYRTRI